MGNWEVSKAELYFSICDLDFQGGAVIPSWASNGGFEASKGLGTLNESVGFGGEARRLHRGQRKNPMLMRNRKSRRTSGGKKVDRDLLVR